MRLQIPYNELEQFLSEYFQQKMIRQIKLVYVDESTIQVSAVAKIKLKVAEATIPVNSSFATHERTVNQPRRGLGYKLKVQHTFPSGLIFIGWTKLNFAAL